MFIGDTECCASKGAGAPFKCIRPVALAPSTGVPERYGYSRNKVEADQGPIFKVAPRFSAGYSGFIGRRDREFSGRPPTEHFEQYVPILVTNADLVVVQRDVRATSLETTNMPSKPEGARVDCLILKHPFPTSEVLDRDFRDVQNPTRGPEDWSQLHKESIYVVQAAALRTFPPGRRIKWRVKGGDTHGPRRHSVARFSAA